MSGGAFDPRDGLPLEISDDLVDEFALRAFFWDYCSLSINQPLSRGFFHGMEVMLRRYGLRSEVTNACKAVAYATHGKVLSRPHLTHRAEALYSHLLRYLATSLHGHASGDSDGVEPLLIAVLLGLYEVSLHFMHPMYQASPS